MIPWAAAVLLFSHREERCSGFGLHDWSSSRILLSTFMVFYRNMFSLALPAWLNTVWLDKVSLDKVGPFQHGLAFVEWNKPGCMEQALTKLDLAWSQTYSILLSWNRPQVVSPWEVTFLFYFIYFSGRSGVRWGYWIGVKAICLVQQPSKPLDLLHYQRFCKRLLSNGISLSSEAGVARNGTTWQREASHAHPEKQENAQSEHRFI